MKAKNSTTTQINKTDKEVFNKKNNNFLKVLNLVLRLNISSERAWVIILALPSVITFVALFCYSKYSSQYRMLPPQILSLMLTTPLVVGMFFSLNIIEWRQTYILVRLRTFGSKPWHVLLSSMITANIFLVIGLCFNFLFSYLMSLSVTEIEYFNLANLEFFNWIFFAICCELMMCLFTVITIFISNFINKRTLGTTMLVFSLVFVLSFSDIVIPSFIGAKNKFLTYFGYINIFKYVTYILLLTSSFAFLDFQGFKQISQNENNASELIFLNNIWLPITLAVVVLIVVSYFAMRNFKWKG